MSSPVAPSLDPKASEHHPVSPGNGGSGGRACIRVTCGPEDGPAPCPTPGSGPSLRGPCLGVQTTPRPTMHSEQFAGRWLRGGCCCPVFLSSSPSLAPRPVSCAHASCPVPSLPASAGKGWGSLRRSVPSQSCPQRHHVSCTSWVPGRGPPPPPGHDPASALCLQLSVPPAPRTTPGGAGSRLSAPSIGSLSTPAGIAVCPLCPALGTVELRPVCPH